MTTDTTPKTRKVLATFQIRMRPDADMEELTRLSESLHELARSTPSIGAIDASSWASDDGTYLIMYVFQSMAAMREFVAHPQHQAVMKRAGEFFEAVRTQVTTIEKQSERVLSD